MYLMQSQKAPTRKNTPQSVNEFQTSILQSARSAVQLVATEDYMNEIQAAMSRAWEVSRKYSCLSTTNQEIVNE